ncbi:hypothetical protein COCON_G00117970 [Conger conger]|uniref:Uncharacterized protein n=1 Tax=Conger conger TaxID=82655 RepID=A0A9Q1DH07_CONCO|nr:hypothetical protein COCON_G00117970 [Conger conger]
MEWWLRNTQLRGSSASLRITTTLSGDGQAAILTAILFPASQEAVRQVHPGLSTSRKSPRPGAFDPVLRRRLQNTAESWQTGCSGSRSSRFSTVRTTGMEALLGPRQCRRGGAERFGPVTAESFISGYCINQTEDDEEMEEAPLDLKLKEPKRRIGSKKRKSSIDTETSPESNNNAKRPPLRRGSSFTFLTPGPQWDFTLKRKRREKDDDAVSLCSFDFKTSCSAFHSQKCLCLGLKMGARTIGAHAAVLTSLHTQRGFRPVICSNALQHRGFHGKRRVGPWARLEGGF